MNAATGRAGVVRAHDDAGSMDKLVSTSSLAFWPSLAAGDSDGALVMATKAMHGLSFLEMFRALHHLFPVVWV
ncbi:hypothetical protein AUP68_05861 [Ilyonectria robusta]